MLFSCCGRSKTKNVRMVFWSAFTTLTVAATTGVFCTAFTTLAVAVTTGLLISFIRKFNLLYIALNPIDDKTKKHGGELVAEVLGKHNVKFIFTLVGGHISPILVAAEKLGIKVVDTRHEVSAVFAADAVARLSGTIGVAVVTAGPGVTNTITAVKNAQLAESPLLLIGGAAATILKGRGALQDIDQMSLFRSICKYTATVTSVRDIVPTLRTAIREAQSDIPGPVFVELPIDVLYPYHLVVREVLGKSAPRGLQANIVHWYLKNYVNNIFAGAWKSRNSSPLPVTIPTANPLQVQNCVELLSKSKKPVLLIGSQAMVSPVAATQLSKAVSSLGIPVFLGGMARGLLGAKSNVQFRHRRSDALKEADLIILAGVVCDFRLSYGRSLSRNAKIISVNRGSEQLTKNSDVYWKPTEAVLSDVATFLAELTKNAGRQSERKEWFEVLRTREDEKQEANYKLSLQPTSQYLNPMKILFDLESVLPDNAILVADGGDFVGTAAYILRPRGPLQWLDPGAFGTLGVGGGFALGAKLCRPDSQVWIIYGDGSCGFSIAELDTMKRFGAHCLALIGNDGGWTQILREQQPMFESSVACKLLHTDYDQVAIGYGCKGFRIDETSSVKEILEKAQKLSENHSVVINALIGHTQFRDGSISV